MGPGMCPGMCPGLPPEMAPGRAPGLAPGAGMVPGRETAPDLETGPKEGQEGDPKMGSGRCVKTAPKAHLLLPGTQGLSVATAQCAVQGQVGS